MQQLATGMLAQRGSSQCVLRVCWSDENMQDRIWKMGLLCQNSSLVGSVASFVTTARPECPGIVLSKSSPCPDCLAVRLQNVMDVCAGGIGYYIFGEGIGPDSPHGLVERLLCVQGPVALVPFPVLAARGQVPQWLQDVSTCSIRQCLLPPVGCCRAAILSMLTA